MKDLRIAFDQSPSENIISKIKVEFTEGIQQI